MEGLLEKEYNLDISLKLKENLQQAGFQVVLTRDEDISIDKHAKSGKSRHQRDLSARASIINASNAKLFLSIHMNSNPKSPKANGAIIFYSDKFEQSKALAAHIQQALNQITFQGKKRTAHDIKKGNYFLLKSTNVPGVIIEAAFLSNQSDRELLKIEEFRDEISKTIAQAVVCYLENEQSFN